MRKLILCMHVSVDGFVAGPSGEMDWIHVDDEIFDYAGNMTDQSDTALYGRVTYQMMESYWPTAAEQPKASKHDIQHSRWYNKVEKVVISKTLKESDLNNIQTINDNIYDEIQKRKNQPGNNILMFGSPTAAHSLMQHNLIDEYWIFVNPIILGQGMLLFKNVNDRISLKLAESKAFNSGVVGLNYKK